jgi:hypothetical protein
MAIKYKTTYVGSDDYTQPKANRIYFVFHFGNLHSITLSPHNVSKFLDKRVEESIRKYGVFCSPGITVKLVVDKNSPHSKFGWFTIRIEVKYIEQLESIMPLGIATNIIENFKAHDAQQKMATVW